ncbi:MAG: hypothetical protein ABIV47_15430 [Roseiflexaceae bacterium]
MEAGSSGEYISLVVRLQAAADGTWYVHVDGANTPHAFALTPITLVVRLWHASSTGTLRGSIRLHDSDHWAPIQSNGQLEELIRAWLLNGQNGTEPQ